MPIFKTVQEKMKEAVTETGVDFATNVLTEHYELDPLESAQTHQYLMEQRTMEKIDVEGVLKPPVFESVSTILSSGEIDTKTAVSVADDTGSYVKVDTTKASKTLNPEEYGDFSYNLARIATGDVRTEVEADVFNKLKSGLQPFVDQIKKMDKNKIVIAGVGVAGLVGIVWWMKKTKKKK